MEVIINGVYSELGNSSPAITKKSIDINNPSTRFIDFTNAFKLPDTETNRKIFKSAYSVGSNNKYLDVLYNVSIIDQFKIFSGKGFLTGYDPKNGYSFQVVDSSKELFNALGVSLRSINWDDKDTELTEAAINALDIADPTTCWSWGKACYHQYAYTANTDQTSGTARTKYSRPGFYLSGLLKRAVEQNGYNFNIPGVDLAMSSNHSQFFFTSYQKTLNGSYSAGTIGGLTTNDFRHSTVTATDTELTVLTNTAFRLRGTVAATGEMYLKVYARNAGTTKEADSTFLIPLAGEVDFTSSEFYDTAAGMIVNFQIVGAGTVTFTNCLLYSLINENTADLSTNLFYGFRIKVYDNLPEMTYLDLFKIICVVGNQYHIVDNFNKVFAFGSMSRLNKMNSVDWSDKFVIDSENITSKFAGLFRKNKLRYTNDISVSPELGESFFTCNNESLQDEGDYLVLNFSASNDAIIAGNKVVHVPIYSDTGRRETPEINIRLFAIEGSQFIFSPISWENIVNNYYAEIFNSLARVREITCQFNLSKLDILSWSEKKLVYVDYFKSTFIVEEISNFIPGNLTKVKMLLYGR